MKIERIDRIAIAVGDIDQAIDFFSDLLGISFDRPARSQEPMGSKELNSAFGLELISPLGHGPDFIQRFLDKRGEGVFAIVLKVDNIDEAVQHFTSRGLRIVGKSIPPPGVLRGQTMVSFHPRDAFGVQIILVQYDEIHPATCASRHRDIGLEET